MVPGQQFELHAVVDNARVPVWGSAEMSMFKPHKKFFVALLTLLAAICACTALLHAQSAKATTDEPGTPAMAADPAFVARANDTVVRARKLIDNFFEETSNVVCTEDVAQTLVAKNNKPMYREESVFDYQLQSSSRTGSLRLSENREAKKAAFRDPSKTATGSQKPILHGTSAYYSWRLGSAPHPRCRPRSKFPRRSCQSACAP